MRTRIKICGFTDADDLQAALSLGIDAIGLNLAKGPRKCSLEQAQVLRQLIPPPVAAVGLFVDASLATIEHALDVTQCDTIQLHGDEPPELAAALMQRCRVIKAIRVRNLAALQAANDYPCHALLLDAYVPGVSGGSGQTWDHRLLADCPPQKPWLLAGGLTPDNVLTALDQLAALGLRPWAIDTASGVELAPGRKNPVQMQRLVQAVQRHDHNQNGAA